MVVKLEARAVSKIFTSFRNGGPVQTPAVRDVSLEVRAGEFLCLLGPSGCGKTTLLQMMAGLERPTAGEILYDGVPVSGPDPRRVYIFQKFVLFPWLTALENVMFGLQFRGLNRARQREIGLRMIEMVRLTRFKDHYPWELSGGMQQRVAIARALAVSPDVFLMDEPFGALDAQTRSEMQAELIKLWIENEAMHKTIVFVTHDIAEACLLGDRVAMMAAGGSLEAILPVTLARPRDPFDHQYVEIVRHLRDQLRREEPPAGAAEHD